MTPEPVGPSACWAVGALLESHQPPCEPCQRSLQIKGSTPMKLPLFSSVSVGVFTPPGQHIFPDPLAPAGSELTETLVIDGAGALAPEMNQVHWQPRAQAGWTTGPVLRGCEEEPLLPVPSTVVHCHPPATGLSPLRSQQGFRCPQDGEWGGPHLCQRSLGPVLAP